MDDEKAEAGSSSSGVDDAQSRVEKLHYQRELRGLELRAYSSVLEALRASGKPNNEKDGIIKTLRNYFNVSEDRHKAELKVLAFDEKLCLISEKLNGHNYCEDWAFDSQRKYAPFSQPPFNVFRSFPSSFTRSCVTVRDPKPVKKSNNRLSKYDEDSDVHSESELELIADIIKGNPAVCNGWVPERHRPLTIAVEPGTGNEEEIEELEQQMKKRLKGKKQLQQQQSFIQPKSPDITDAPRTPNSKGEGKQGSAPGKVRSIKRKQSDEYNALLPNDHHGVTTPSSKKFSQLTQNKHKIKRGNRTQARIKISRRSQVPSGEETLKAKDSSEETSSADEGENGPLPLDESSRVMSPVFSEVIRASVLSRSNKAQRVRSGSGMDRRKNSALSSPSKIKAGKARPNQKAGKFKNSIPTSGSRRKSKLNEKIDYDDVLMDLDGNEMMESHHHHQTVYASSSDEIPRRLMLDSHPIKEYRSTEDNCAIYAESLPINFNHEDMEQVTDGVFKRPLPPSKGPKPWELKDARLTQREESVSDENNGSTINYEMDGGYQQHGNPENSTIIANNINDATGCSTPIKNEHLPLPKKQRIKSPLVVNPNVNPPNVPKVPLPAPVFSTSLSAVNKKRQNSKSVSVVDSLNLHLPTSPTASSLAASSNNRRPGAAAGGGCSMFSNSSALIAGARGTAPGILQQQRKAQPHILANSKVHQRAFSPAAGASSSVPNNNNSASVTSNNGNAPISVTPSFSATTAIPATSPVAAAATVPGPATFTAPVPPSPIPISAMSPLPPSSPTPIPISFPNSNAPSLSIGPAGIPIGRPGQGPNIIFVQKSNGPGVGAASPGPNNIIPLRPQPPAVILRRTPTIRRQNNVMFVDMPKAVAPGQTPPFLQTARILNAPGELSLLNIQPGSSPIKVSPASSIGISRLTSSENPPMQTLLSPPQLNKTPEGGIVIQTTNPEAFLASLSNAAAQAQINHHHQLNNIVVSSASHLQAPEHDTVVTDQHGNESSEGDNDTTQGNEPPQDAQYAQIEAELMQMEEGSFEDVVYEEEVTTEIVPLEEDGATTQYIFTTETATTEGSNVVTTSQETSSTLHNSSPTIVNISTSSTDTASETDSSIQHLESPNIDRQAMVKTVCLSPAEDMKVATDAISRALSLSKSSAASPVKSLTFSAPITIGSTTFNLTSSGKVMTTETITVPINSIDSTATFQTVSTAELHSTPHVKDIHDNDSSSTNNIHVEDSGQTTVTTEVAIQQSNEIQQCEAPMLETTSAS